MNLQHLLLLTTLATSLNFSSLSGFTIRHPSRHNSGSTTEVAMENYSDEKNEEKSHPYARDYYAPMSEQEKKDISYIITTLATKSHFSLLFEKRSLNRAGDRVAHVHPLRFLSFMFSDSQLKNYSRNIRGLPWRRFSNDMGDSLEKSAKRRNMKEEYIADYVNTVGVRKDLLTPLAESGRWVDFINVTRNNLP